MGNETATPPCSSFVARVGVEYMGTFDPAIFKEDFRSGEFGVNNNRWGRTSTYSRVILSQDARARDGRNVPCFRRLGITSSLLSEVLLEKAFSRVNEASI